MPLSTEVVQNKPLSGTELIDIVCNDLRDILSRDGMFSSYIAYGRIAYTVDVTFHMDNPSHPIHNVRVRSRKQAAQPAIDSVLPLPEASEEEAFVGLRRERTIDSPNLTRVHNDLPIPVQAWEDVEGKPRLVNRDIHYDKRDLPELPPPVDTDTTVQVEQKLKRRGRPPKQ